MQAVINYSQALRISRANVSNHNLDELSHFLNFGSNSKAANAARERT
jgi:hypothetical protein